MGSENILRPVIIHALANARSERHSVAGSYIRLRTSTTASIITVFLDNDKSLPMYAGRWVRIPFQSIAILNPDGVAIDVEFDVSDHDVGDDSRVVSGAIDATIVNAAAIDVEVTNAAPIDVNVANAAQTVYGSFSAPTAIVLNVGNGYADSEGQDLTRLGGFIVQNTGLNDVWVGDANVDPGNKVGLLLVPGASVALPTTDDVFFKSIADATVSIVRFA